MAYRHQSTTRRRKGITHRQQVTICTPLPAPYCYYVQVNNSFWLCYLMARLVVYRWLFSNKLISGQILFWPRLSPEEANYEGSYCVGAPSFSIPLLVLSAARVMVVVCGWGGEDKAPGRAAEGRVGEACSGFPLVNCIIAIRVVNDDLFF